MAKYNCNRPGCIDVYRASLVHDAEYAGEPEIPVLAPTEALPDEMTPFSQAISSGKRSGWVHFFEDDAKFERIWNSPDRYLEALEGFDGAIAPDFSVYRDMPLAMQQWNIYRSRAWAHALQARGGRVIANLRFGDERTFETACLGIPGNASFAVGTHGLLRDADDRALLSAGVDYAVGRLEPEAIVVYGPAPEDVFGRHRKAGVRILQFDSRFSQTHRRTR